LRTGTDFGNRVCGPPSHVTIGIAGRQNQSGQRAQRVHFLPRFGRVSAPKVDEDKRCIAFHLNIHVAERLRQCANGFIAEPAKPGGDFISSLFQRIDSSIASGHRPALHRHSSHLLHDARSVILNNDDARSRFHCGRSNSKTKRK